MLLLFSVGLQRLKALYFQVYANFVSDYGVQRCQITEVVFNTKVLVNDILDKIFGEDSGLHRCWIREA